MCNKAVRINPLSLPFVPDCFKTQEMCDAAAREDPCELEFVPDHFKTQEMCNEAVPRYSYLLEHVPEHFKTKEMCDKTVRDDPFVLQYVPDWFVTREGVYMWRDQYYDDAGGYWVARGDDKEDNFFEFYDGYQKRKTQKAQIKEKLLPTAWQQSKWQDWRVPEDKKKEINIVEVTKSCFSLPVTVLHQ